MLSTKAIIYLISFVVIELLVIIMMFEFLRKPWDGAEIELERVLALQEVKLFNDSISEMTMTEL